MYTVRNSKLSCFDPKTVASESCKQSVSAFRVLVRSHEANHVDDGYADAFVLQ